MRKLLLVGLALIVSASLTYAQDRTVSGKVTSAEDGSAVPGVNIVVKGTTTGAVTDIDGNWKLTVPADGATLIFSFIGLETQEVEIGNRSVIDISLASDAEQLSEVVVTALGVTREKASLGYSTQEVGGEEVTAVRDMNFMNSLSGKVSGVQIKRSNQMGGSTNIVVRGYKSLTGDNQALFVVDGVIMSNAITNTSNQQTGRGGFDYGNAAMDINPDDIESINILKGAAATALYGSRAANGVVAITTKKGAKGKKGLGITASFGSTFGTIDESTFIRHQNKFGAGYSTVAGWYASDGSGVDPDGYDYYDFGTGDGPQLSSATYEDASFGPALDGTMAYDWRSFYPELDTYGQQFPQNPSNNQARTFYETARTLNTNISVQGGSEAANYRLSFTNADQNGVLPNSSIVRNTIAFSGGYEVNDRIKVSSTVNYSVTDALGRFGTGYDNRNPNQSFRQWYQASTDMVAQKEAYDKTGLNISWNPYGPLDPARESVPHYFDNPYFNRYENYNNDTRNRIYGNFMLDVKILDWMTFTGRASRDGYSEIREERIAVGSVDVSRYYRQNRNHSENNFDFFLKMNGNINDDFSIGGLLGINYRRTKTDAISSQTNGGLITPGVYALSNSVSTPNAPAESFTEVGTDGYFGQLNLGYANMLYLDVTGRYDIASTLPEESNSYFYPSASLAFIFSELMPSDVLSLGKFRINYAEVGNLAPAKLTNDIFILNPSFNGVPLASASAIRRNPALVSELTKSYEVGVELGFLQDRIGFDVAYYNTNSFNQVFSAEVTGATGRRTDVVNAGEIQNRGFEASLIATPIRNNDFNWRINLNWTRNRNEVISLLGDQDNLQLSSAQGGITLNATVGQPFGTIRGTNYVYDDQGRPIVYPHWESGVRFRKTATPEVIGDINPDWMGGVQNTLTYKGVTMSFLIDVQVGGDFFSLDTWYGYATGVYDFTAETNKNGMSNRDLPGDGGGVYLDDLDYLNGMVTVSHATDANGDYVYDANGNPVGGDVNTEAFYSADVYTSLGYVYAPNAFHIYDASYVKLRELTIGYSLPKSMLGNSPFQSVDLSLFGRNLWIIHKNSPYSDPEAGLSAGNNLGNQSGAYPSVKEYGFNIGLKF